MPKKAEIREGGVVKGMTNSTPTSRPPTKPKPQKPANNSKR